MKEAAVVILNYNGLHLLKQFLPSVLALTPEADIVVADNASTDGSVEWLQNNLTETSCLIEIPENLGFCGGYNYALSKLSNTYFVLLNSDIEVTEGWLPPLLKALKDDLKIAACQPKIKSYTQKSHFEYAGAAGGFIDLLGYPFARGRIFDTTEEDRGQYDETCQVFWASGACMCIRAGLFKKYQLDEYFFAHMEEIDLCWRMQNDGHVINCIPESTVYHVGGGTLQKDNPKKTYYNFRNGLFLLYKNLPAYSLLPVLFARMMLDGIAGVKFLSESKFDHFKSVLRAHKDFYFGIPKLERRGGKQAKRKKFYSLTTVAKELIVTNYFLRGIKTFQLLKIARKSHQQSKKIANNTFIS